MRFPSVLIFIVLVSILAAPLAGAAGDTPNVPVAVVPEPGFEHPSVLEGKELFHDYIIRNTGTAELEIKQVRTG